MTAKRWLRRLRPPSGFPLSRLVLILALISVALVPPLDGSTLPYHLNCDLGKGSPQVMQVPGLMVSLVPRDTVCYLKVESFRGKILFESNETGIQVFSPVDLARDERQFLLVQVDSSPYRLEVIQIGSHPRIVTSVENKYGFWLQKGCADDRWHIWTADGAFQGAPELLDVYHYDLLIPEIALRLRGNSLVDASPSCRGYFDRRIAALRAGLTDQEIAAFRNNRIDDAFRKGEVKGRILGIIFAELYAGDKSAARQVLREMWPSKDQELIWRWILQKRSEGMLSHLNSAGM